MYRFLLSSRWVAGLAGALVVAAVCVLLGAWQWDRREQRLERNEALTSNYDRDPVALADVLSGPDGELRAGGEWTPVRVSGRYSRDGTLLLRNRPLDGRPGYHALVPLALSGGGSGESLLVDRGWVPGGADGTGPDAVPVPPPGDVEVVVRLRPPEPGTGQGAPPGQLTRIDLASIADEQGQDLVTGAYGVLGTEQPAPDDAPVVLPRPVVDEGPHLSYTLQWFVFALGALVGYGVVARRHAVDTAAGGRPVTGAPRRPTAEQEEDAILDAAAARETAQRAGTPGGLPG